MHELVSFSPPHDPDLNRENRHRLYVVSLLIVPSHSNNSIQILDLLSLLLDTSYILGERFCALYSRNLVPSAKIDTFSCNAQENLELQGKIPKESNEARHEELRKCIQKTLSTLNLQNCEWQYLYLETCLASWGGQNDRLLDPVWWGRRAGWAPARTEPPGGTNKVTASFPTIFRAVERNFRAQYLYQYCMYGRYPFSKSGPTKKRFRKQSPAMFQVSRLWRRKPNFFSQGEHNANKPGFGSRWWGARLEP
jgi:hypothetical protein